ncbi:MAG: hypothetical protein HPY69_17155 [Armatimonadetes bacterium]|nr:hypothetical protein [Armatimonadota bacterium]
MQSAIVSGLVASGPGHALLNADGNNKAQLLTRGAAVLGQRAVVRVDDGPRLPNIKASFDAIHLFASAFAQLVQGMAAGQQPLLLLLETLRGFSAIKVGQHIDLSRDDVHTVRKPSTS